SDIGERGVINAILEGDVRLAVAVLIEDGVGNVREVTIGDAKAGSREAKHAVASIPWDRSVILAFGKDETVNADDAGGGVVRTANACGLDRAAVAAEVPVGAGDVCGEAQSAPNGFLICTSDWSRIVSGTGG